RVVVVRVQRELRLLPTRFEVLVPEGAARHPDVLDHVSGQRVGDVAEEESHATGQHVPAERRNREVGVFGPVRPPVADGLYEPATGTRQIKGPKVGPGGTAGRGRERGNSPR